MHIATGQMNSMQELFDLVQGKWGIWDVQYPSSDEKIYNCASCIARKENVAKSQAVNFFPLIWGWYSEDGWGDPDDHFMSVEFAQQLHIDGILKSLLTTRRRTLVTFTQKVITTRKEEKNS